jgi:site-specific recombinase XerD
MARKTFKQKIVTDELIEKINSKNRKLMDAFLKEKNTRSSDTTIEAYRSDLYIFFCYNVLYNENKFFIDIKKLEFADFFSYVTSELQWKSARFSRMRACLSSLSQFIEKFYDDEYPMFKNTILKVVENMPKNEAREKTILSEPDINKLLGHLKNKDTQQACWLALAFASGARFSELLRFTVDLIDENRTAFEGIFLETTKMMKTKGRTKTGKMIYKYIVKDIFLPYYKLWIEERSEILKSNDVKEHGYLFVKKDGTPAVAGTVRSWITGMTSYMGVDIYPHAFRHSITTHLSTVGLPDALIQEIMGWSNALMVAVYNDVTAKDKKWSELDGFRKDLDDKKI